MTASQFESRTKEDDVRRRYSKEKHCCCLSPHNVGHVTERQACVCEMSMRGWRREE
ncbi:hypothetical protein WUBG_03866, partial [Wuchereria bancrofti]